MSLFLTMLVCRVKSKDQVMKAIIKVMKKRSFELASKQKVNEITGKENQFEISDVKNGLVQVFCPETIDKNFVKELSKELDSAIFAFSIVDGTYWIYELLVSGILKDKHDPIPDYWEDISSKEKKKCKGNASVLSSLFNVPKSKIEKYLFFWDLEEENEMQDPWKMVDFQKEFGIEYPDFEKPETIHLIRLTFRRR